MDDMPKLKEMLDNIDLTVLNTEYLTVGTEWNYRYVNNPYSRIYYITAGFGRIVHHDRNIDLTPGNLYLIPCFTTVNMYCDKSFTHYYVHFTSRTGTGLDILSILDFQFQASLKASGIDKSLFDRLIELNPNRPLIEYDAKKSIYNEVLARAYSLDAQKSPANLIQTNALLRLLLAAFFAGHDQTQTESTLTGITRFQSSIEYIQENIESPIELAHLARIEHLNTNYYCSQFRKLMGISPMQYVNKRRIEEAQRLLLSTNDILFDISQKIGFKDEYYFSRIFKKTVGISPANYRKQQTLLQQRS
jgi:AraC-like DNA-binding protein